MWLRPWTPLQSTLCHVTAHSQLGAPYCPPPCSALVPAGPGQQVTRSQLPGRSHAVCLGWGRGFPHASQQSNGQSRSSAEAPQSSARKGRHPRLRPMSRISNTAGGGQPSPSRTPHLTPAVGTPGQHQPSHRAQPRASPFLRAPGTPGFLRPSRAQLQPTEPSWLPEPRVCGQPSALTCPPDPAVFLPVLS